MTSNAATLRQALGIVLTVYWTGVGCSKPPLAPEVKADSLDHATAQLIQDARRTVGKNESDATAWGRYGEVLHSAEFFSDAALCYRQATELEPSTARWWHLRGIAELQLSQESALNHLSHAAELAGDTLDTPRLRLAQSLIERGRLDEADRHLGHLLKVQPQHPAARLEAGRLGLLKGDLAQAAEQVQPCLTNPFTARAALLLLAQVEQRRGNSETAARMSVRAASMPRPFDWPDPFLRDVQAHRVGPKRLADQANNWLIQHRLGEARGIIQTLRSQFPSEPEGLLLEGRLQYLERGCGQAEQTFRQYLSLESGSLNGRMQLALALLCQQKWVEAIAVLREAVALKPDFLQAHFNLGIAWVRVGDLSAAAAAFESGLRCNPADLNTLLSLTDVSLRQGDKAGAKKYWDRAHDLYPKEDKVLKLGGTAGFLAERAN